MCVETAMSIREMSSCALLSVQFMVIKLNRLHSSHPVIPITIQVNFVEAVEIDVKKDEENRRLQKKSHAIIRNVIKINAYDSYLQKWINYTTITSFF